MAESPGFPTPFQEDILLVMVNKGEFRGEALRAVLAENGRSSGRSAFYRAMQRAEEAGFVTSRYGSVAGPGQHTRRTYYMATESGERALAYMQTRRSNLAASRRPAEES